MIKYEKIINEHIIKYDKKLEMTILDRFLSVSLSRTTNQNNDFSDDECEEYERLKAENYIPTIIFGNNEFSDYSQNLFYINFFRIKFPFIEIFEDLYKQKHSGEKVDYLNVGHNDLVESISFLNKLKKETFVFLDKNNPDDLSPLLSYYSEVENNLIGPYEPSVVVMGNYEELKYVEDRNIESNLRINTVLTIILQNEGDNHFKLVLIPNNIKYGKFQYLHMNTLEFDNELSNLIYRTKGIKRNNIKIDYIGYFELIEKEFGEKTLEYLLNKYMDVFKQYERFFQENSVSNIINEYKPFIVEELKITSNILFETQFPINPKLTISYNLKIIKEEYNLEPVRINYNEIEYLKNFNYKNNDVRFELLNNEKIYRPLITSEWLYNDKGENNELLNTFISLGYLKSVDAVLYEVIVLSNNYNIKENMITNDLIKILEENNSYITIFNLKTFKKLKDWNNNIRNVFINREMINQEELNKIRKETYKLIFELLNNKL